MNARWTNVQRTLIRWWPYDVWQSVAIVGFGLLAAAGVVLITLAVILNSVVMLVGALLWSATFVTLTSMSWWGFRRGYDD